MAEGRRKSVERAAMFGKPTFRWIGARQRLKTTWTVFLAEIPKDYRGTADVQRQADKIVIRERENGRTITLNSR